MNSIRFAMCSCIFSSGIYFRDSLFIGLILKNINNIFWMMAVAKNRKYTFAYSCCLYCLLCNQIYKAELALSITEYLFICLQALCRSRRFLERIWSIACTQYSIYLKLRCVLNFTLFLYHTVTIALITVL